MSFVLVIIGSLVALDLVWLAISIRLARGRRWQPVLALFMLAQLAGLAVIIGGRILHAGWDRLLPKFAIATIFIWHFLGIPLLLLAGVLLLPALVWRAIRAVNNPRRSLVIAGQTAAVWNRREFVKAAAALTPAVVTLSLGTIATRQLNQFRIRRYQLPIHDLPRDLDRLTITQVSDMHVGRFTSGRVLRDMVSAVNELRADLLLLTGDLINDALADLSSAIEIVRSMDAGSGVYLIEGNHDLIEDAGEFERRMRASAIPFLLDQSVNLSLRGAPVQLLGLSWTRARQNRDAAISQSVRQLLQRRDPTAFPILLAHHPHAFDAAAEASIPLTLSGHTHGGQLMLNEQLGFGPALFRYWSGLYTRSDSKLVVSNGVGNWFPLRTAAPAEIVHLTLRRA